MRRCRSLFRWRLPTAPSRGDLDRVECVDMAVVSLEDIAAEEERVRPRHTRSGPDKVYRGFAFASGGLTLTRHGADRAVPGHPSVAGVALGRAQLLHDTRRGSRRLGKFGVWAALLGTFLIALIALVIAVPVATCSALFVTEYAPARMRRPLTSFIDVLAAIPSLIYGLWGAGVPPARGDPPESLARHAPRVHPVLQDADPENVASYPASTFIAGARRGLDDRADLHRGDARGLLAGAGGREGGRARRSAARSGASSRSDPAVRRGRHGRRRDARARPRARRDDRGHAHHLAEFDPPTSRTCCRRRQLDRIAHRAAVLASRTSSASARSWPPASRLFVITLIVNAIASVIVMRSRSGAATEI